MYSEQAQKWSGLLVCAALCGGKGKAQGRFIIYGNVTETQDF